MVVTQYMNTILSAKISDTLERSISSPLSVVVRERNDKDVFHETARWEDVLCDVDVPVSASEDPNKVGTLEMILERLRSTFEAHGFNLDTGRQIPKDFSGAQMAVVTAHGGLTTEKRFIHRISDEEVLAESPETLARALAGVEIVILFVCSGGRSDRHPLGNTTVGLPKMLLDRGCRTVIASPWPLSAVVTGPWLEEFMVAWDEGDTAAAAVFRANQAVYKRLGDPPQYSLAMTVHGDLLLTKAT